MRKSLQIRKNRRVGFTLVELLVVIAVIALLMAILLPALSKAREQGKRAVCMVQIKQMQIAWAQYADDSDDKVVTGDTIYCWNFPAGSPTGGPQGSWFEYPHRWPNSTVMAGVCPLDVPPYRLPGSPGVSPYIPIANATKEDWYHGIEDGKLWKYIGDHKIYRCPVGEKNAYVTNYMSHSLRTYYTSGGTDAPYIYRKSQIKRTAERFIFLDVGWVKSGGGAYYTPFSTTGGGGEPKKWYDTPPTRHGMGTVFSFADNHSEYRKWTDPHTIEATKHPWGGTGWPDAIDNDDCDLRWFSVSTWGRLSSKHWTSTTAGCEY